MGRICAHLLVVEALATRAVAIPRLSRHRLLELPVSRLSRDHPLRIENRWFGELGEFVDGFLGNLSRCGFEIRRELIESTDPDDHGGDAWASEQPLDRQRGWRGFVFRGELDEGVDDIEPAVAIDWRKRAEFAGGEAASLGVRLLLTPVFSGEKAPRQGAPGEDRDVFAQAEWYDLVLDVAADEAVVHLRADEFRQTLGVRDTERLGRLPGREIAEADRKHLARIDQVIERSEGFFQRRERVESVDLIKVDAISGQPLERRLAGANEMKAAQASIVGAGAHPAQRLRGENDAVALASERLTEEDLGITLAIHVGGVEEVDAGVHRL